MIAGTATLLSIVTWLRLRDLQVGTWDFGIYQQALWSTAHGRPFYETPDLETGGFYSFLQVHTAFVLYGVVPLYAAFPSPVTLLLIQSTIVALAGLPLYFLARLYTGKDAWAAGVVGLYLLGLATVSATMYDFHIESFVPLGYFTFLLFFERRQYVLAAVAAFLAFLTMEVFPVLFFAVALFYLLPPVVQLGRNLLRRTASHSATDVRDAGRLLPAATLAVVSVIALILLVLTREEWLSGWLGLPTFPSSAVPNGYVIGFTPGALGLSADHLSIGLDGKLWYWLALLASTAFVPLLSPRALVLSLPWFGFTLLSANVNYAILGFQYGFIAGPPLIVAFALGLPRLAELLHTPRLDFLRRARSSTLVERGAPRWKGQTVGVAAIALLVSLNLLATPLNPMLDNHGLGSAYRFTYAVPPGFAATQTLVATIPSDAAIVATDDLFPFVANDINAYSFHWDADPTLYLPFSPSEPPPFVLFSEDRWYAVPGWLSNLLYNQTIYGLRGDAYPTPAGAVLLFERAYAGAVLDAGGPPPSSAEWWATAMGAGPAARLGPDPAAPTGSALLPNLGTEGMLWQGPGGVLGPGNYTASFLLRTMCTPGAQAIPDTTPVISINGNAFGQPLWFAVDVPMGDLNRTSYAPVQIHLTVPELSVEVIFRAYSLNLACSASFAGVQLSGSA